MQENIFRDVTTAQKYIHYLETTDGKFQQQALLDAIYPRLNEKKAKLILDAGCGTGWLTHALSEKGLSVTGCDSSVELLKHAWKSGPTTMFNEVDITKPLPYPANYFDAIIVNMAAQDVLNLTNLYQSISRPLRLGGWVFVTIPNPYYAYPVGVWKRGILGKLLGRKPKLILPHKAIAQEQNKPIATFARPLPDYINQALASGLTFTHLQEIKSLTDSKTFGLEYQLHRYPLLLLLEFRK